MGLSHTIYQPELSSIIYLIYYSDEGSNFRNTVINADSQQYKAFLPSADSDVRQRQTLVFK